jgi:hypothetical protein
VDYEHNVYSGEADALIGARPFGKGLGAWLERSPGFNMQKMRTPLLVSASGRFSLLGAMWEPYASLRYLEKPVDLVLFHSDEHVLTDPAVRLASQGGSVEWFRFWLQGYESSDPAKALQYRRWEQLCDMQEEQEPGRRTFCERTEHRRDRHMNSKVAVEGPKGLLPR